MTPPAIRDNVQEEMGVNVKIVTLKNILGINVETFLDWKIKFLEFYQSSIFLLI